MPSHALNKIAKYSRFTKLCTSMLTGRLILKVRATHEVKILTQTNICIRAKRIFAILLLWM